MSTADVIPIPTPHMQMHTSLIVCGPELLECDACDRPSPTVHVGDGATARDIAESEGWMCDAAADRDICPTCLARGER